MSGFNQDSLKGDVKGTSYNCSLVAMSNVGMDVTGIHCSKRGMRTIEAVEHIKKQKCAEFIGDSGSIRQFAKRNPRGRYFVVTNNHFVAVVDGQILNCTRNKRVRFAYRITEKGESQ
jgi:hypothetical protein